MIASDCDRISQYVCSKLATREYYAEQLFFCNIVVTLSLIHIQMCIRDSLQPCSFSLSSLESSDLLQALTVLSLHLLAAKHKYLFANTQNKIESTKKSHEVSFQYKCHHFTICNNKKSTYQIFVSQTFMPPCYQTGVYLFTSWRDLQSHITCSEL